MVQIQSELADTLLSFVVFQFNTLPGLENRVTNTKSLASGDYLLKALTYL